MREIENTQLYFKAYMQKISSHGMLRFRQNVFDTKSRCLCVLSGHFHNFIGLGYVYVHVLIKTDEVLVKRERFWDTGTGEITV